MRHQITVTNEGESDYRVLPGGVNTAEVTLRPGEHIRLEGEAAHKVVARALGVETAVPQPASDNTGA